MTNIFFFSLSRHILSRGLHKSNTYFLFFSQIKLPMQGKIPAALPMTPVSKLFVKVYFYEQIVESTISSNKGNKRKWGEIPRLASNRDAFRTTRRETSYRLDVKISLGQKHTSMRKGKQAKKEVLVTATGSSLGGTFRLILVKHVETAMYKTRCM